MNITNYAYSITKEVGMHCICNKKTRTPITYHINKVEACLVLHTYRALFSQMLPENRIPLDDLVILKAERKYDDKPE